MISQTTLITMCIELQLLNTKSLIWRNVCVNKIKHEIIKEDRLFLDLLDLQIIYKYNDLINFTVKLDKYFKQMFWYKYKLGSWIRKARAMSRCKHKQFTLYIIPNKIKFPINFDRKKSQVWWQAIPNKLTRVKSKWH